MNKVVSAITYYHRQRASWEARVDSAADTYKQHPQTAPLSRLPQLHHDLFSLAMKRILYYAENLATFPEAAGVLEAVGNHTGFLAAPSFRLEGYHDAIPTAVSHPIRLDMNPSLRVLLPYVGSVGLTNICLWRVKLLGLFEFMPTSRNGGGCP